MVSHNDREILRALAGRVAHIAALPEQCKRREDWLEFNALRPKRPMLLAFPENAWGELVPDDSLRCEDEFARDCERQLRMKIYQWEHIRDDNTVDPFFDVQWIHTQGDFGVPVTQTRGDAHGSFTWDPPLKNLPDDLGKLSFRRPAVDRPATGRAVERAQDLFGGILPVRLRGSFWWTAGMTCDAIALVGLDNFMVLMYMQPDIIHQLMAFLRDDWLNFMQWHETKGFLTLNNGSDCVGSGGVGHTHELPGTGSAAVQLADIWGLSESQESVGISPELFQEFILPYQAPVFQKFGLLCYGCCEPLQDRIDAVLKTATRLRRVSVSPWCDQRVMKEKLDNKYIFSRKPNPSHVCTEFNEDTIRGDLRETLAIAGEGPLEIILKDTHTVRNEPWRLTRWVEIAREEVNAYMESDGRRANNTSIAYTQT
ncbi:MAG: hypothetical protein GF418_03680 [Chitinivibrionales bacterium]|nr:hypothetical protein [Chitinivibrionales bacterium]MBD3394705.1 hypothetical protein [Chitinivibrionales bacterium]